jgi:3-methyladenine DNA glycosylase AlkC
MAVALKAAWPAFAQAEFEATATTGLEALELMARVRHISAALAVHLPQDFEAALVVLLGALGEKADPAAVDVSTRGHGGLSGFAMMAVTRFVAEQGLAHHGVSLAALGEMTGRFSAEFDVRPFLAAQPAETWPVLLGWARGADVHRRRLASEGTRAYLPWGRRVPALVSDPEPGLALLELLKDDPSEYVRRSVANHLNDVTRNHPDRVVAVCARWSEGATAERTKLVRHALRGLLKKAHPGAMRLLGYDPDVAVALEDLVVAPSVRVGEALQFGFTLRHLGEAPATVIIDYVFDRPMARGRAPKIFRLAQRALPAASALRYDPSHSFRPVSTRRDRPGRWGLGIRVNGRVLGEVDFVLEAV